MILDPVLNFPKVTVSTGYDDNDTAIALSSGHGAKLPDPATDGEFDMVWWNVTDYPDPADDPNAEFVTVSARSGDNLTVVRAQQDTTGTVKNLSGKNYRMMITVSKKTFDQIAAHQLTQGLMLPLPKRFTSYESMDSGWADWYGGAGSAAHDSTDKVGGSASIKVITDGAGGIEGMRKNITDVDWSAKAFRIWVKADDWSKVSQADILISTGGTFTDFYACNVKNQISALVDDEWIEIYLTRDSFVTGAGTPNWATAEDMIVRVIDTSAGAATVWFDEFGAFADGSEGFVSVVFDDSWDSQYTQGKLKMDAYGYRGTLFTIPEAIGTAGCLTETQLDLMHEQGWEIAGHGATNLKTLETTSQATLEAELQRVRQWLADRGYRGQDLYAYPEGGHNINVCNTLLRWFSFGRALAAGENPTSAVNPRHASSRTVVQGDSTATLQALIDNAVTNKKWLILTFHKIVTTPSVDTEYSIANFGTIIDYLYTNNVNVLPVGEVIRRLS